MNISSEVNENIVQALSLSFCTNGIVQKVVTEN